MSVEESVDLPASKEEAKSGTGGFFTFGWTGKTGARLGPEPMDWVYGVKHPPPVAFPVTGLPIYAGHHLVVYPNHEHLNRSRIQIWLSTTLNSDS